MNEPFSIKFDLSWSDRDGVQKGVWNPCNRSEWLNHISPGQIESMTSEDEFQYLSYYEAIDFARNVFEFLIEGGRFRIAVPDRNNPSRLYHQKYRPDGLFQMLPFSRKFNRKVKTFWDYYFLIRMLRGIGFDVYPLEFFDENGQFVKNDWDIKDGLVKHRSGNNSESQFLIIDAVKP